MKKLMVLVIVIALLLIIIIPASTASAAIATKTHYTDYYDVHIATIAAAQTWESNNNRFLMVYARLDTPWYSYYGLSQIHSDVHYFPSGSDITDLEAYEIGYGETYNYSSDSYMDTSPIEGSYWAYHYAFTQLGQVAHYWYGNQIAIDSGYCVVTSVQLY